MRSRRRGRQRSKVQWDMKRGRRCEPSSSKMTRRTCWQQEDMFSVPIHLLSSSVPRSSRRTSSLLISTSKSRTLFVRNLFVNSVNWCWAPGHWWFAVSPGLTRKCQLEENFRGFFEKWKRRQTGNLIFLYHVSVFGWFIPITYTRIAHCNTQLAQRDFRGIIVNGPENQKFQFSSLKSFPLNEKWARNTGSQNFGQKFSIFHKILNWTIFIKRTTVGPPPFFSNHVWGTSCTITGL